tara:strand:- start:461 stop:1045 length:585 start_codon:yes stop_codon:yes gene_type:complete
MNKISLLILLVLFVNFGCGKKEKVSSEQNPSVTQNDSSSNEATELKEPVTPVEEPVTPVEEPVTPVEEPLKITVDLDTVDFADVEVRDGLQYIKGSSDPYTGKVLKSFDNGNWQMELDLKDGMPDGKIVTYYKNGQKKEESYFKGGKPADGEWLGWHENGELKIEIIIENGETISEKYWNSEGDPVDSRAESEK